ncbi:MAG: energy transducer TonB [candidate division KSB1 bacterium]|nr:energy transducer TonB [candidate division KSB1 bacterium]MDZ7368922.1 energy transducer TonB [candidate division KSB1 bacterium]MDZ7406910.1 energy transducer TonB [candidate division KSB1 bacterium]
MAKRAGIEGTVWVKIQLDENGKVREALVQKSSQPDLGFEEAAIAAAKSFEFSPKNQQPVAMWITMPFHFKLSQIEKTDQKRQAGFQTVRAHRCFLTTISDGSFLAHLVLPFFSPHNEQQKLVEPLTFRFFRLS